MILQNVTVQAIVCRAHDTERPVLKLSGVAAAVAEPAGLTESQDQEGAWTLRFSVPPGTYTLDVIAPYRHGNPGCVYLTRFTVLPGYDRHFAGMLMPPKVIGGLGFNRSVYGTLPFMGMVATIQPLDVHDAPETRIPVDGTMYDAESLGAMRYILRFYFTPGDMEGPKFGSVQIDLRKTRQLTKIQRAVTVQDLTAQ
jgi:hypothetical protein